MISLVSIFRREATMFPKRVTVSVSKTVVDFFVGKSEAEIQKYIALCHQAKMLQKKVTRPGLKHPATLLFCPSL